MTEQGIEKKKLGTGAKVAIGCGSGCLVVIILAVLAIAGGAIYVKKMITKYETELKGYGFEQVTEGQMLNVTEPITQPVLLKAQSLQLRADCSTDLAVLAQICEVYGKVDGKLYFRGQMLTVHPGAEITGGVDAQAQIIQNNGTISGGMTGKYQLLEQGKVAE
ncbi:hypothetical protein P4B35_05875 [Pontiellaceae bacterium B12227]|nr:hypothetical protein [Pontiellaceae bacterium B12227]